jgi:hypothetical protein
VLTSFTIRNFKRFREVKIELGNPVFFKKVNLPNLMSTSDYHVLARFVPADEIAPEIPGLLDEIVDVASRARPVQSEERA